MTSLPEKIYFLFNTFCTFLFELIFALFHQTRVTFIKRLALQLAKKNILYVKLFQAIAMNKNLIDDETNNELMRFTDSAPYDDTDVDMELFCKVKDEYNLDWHSYEPIKAGMISLVFKLCDETNKNRVILKMKRKNIDSKLNKAIDYLQFFVYIVSFIPYSNTFDITSVFNKNIETLKQQLDFNQEVQNMREAEEKCKNLKYVKIPRVYDEVTEKYPDVIMMEFIEGKTIQEIAEEDYSEYAALLLKYGMASFLIHGVTHGDLHAGNILFLNNESLPKYQVCLLDFGIVLRVEEDIRSNFLKIAVDMFEKPARELSRDLLFLYIEPTSVLQELPSEHLDRILDIMEQIIDNTIHSKNQADQSKLYQCMMEINSYINNHDLSSYGLKVNDSFVKTQMALAMCNGINMVLCKNDYITFANKTINEMFHLDLFKESECESKQ